MSGFAYVVRHGAAEAVPLKQALGATGELRWIHIATNDAHAKAWLSAADLPAYVTEALTATETRPRCDAIGAGAVLNLRGLSDEELPGSDLLASIRVYVEAGIVFSVTRKTLRAIAPLRKQVEIGAILDPGDLITALALAITEELDPVVADLGDALDDCEEQVSTNHASSLRRQVNQVRVASISYRRFLVPQRTALEKLANMPIASLAKDDRIHLTVAADRAARMAEELEAIRERAALTHEMLTDLRGEQIDQRALTVSIVAMVFLPLTFITGLLGMNVAGIPFAQEPWAFLAISILCVVIAAVVASYFIARHWFDR